MAMLTPIAALGLQRMMSEQHRNIVLVLAALVTIFIGVWISGRTIESSLQERRNFQEAQAYLAEEFSDAKTMYGAGWYRLVKGAGLVPVSDMDTMSHFSVGGTYSYQVLTNLENSNYDLILDSPYWQRVKSETSNPAYDLAGWWPYYTLINEHYELVEDSELPALLTGQLYVRGLQSNVMNVVVSPEAKS